MDTRIRVEGLNLLNSNLRRFVAGYPAEQKRIHGRVADPVVSRAKSRARVRSGRMRGTIRRRQPTEEGVEIAAGEGIAYGAVQHWGWPARNISPNLYLTEALEEMEDTIVDIYEKATDDYLERIWIDG